MCVCVRVCHVCTDWFCVLQRFQSKQWLIQPAVQIFSHRQKSVSIINSASILISLFLYWTERPKKISLILRLKTFLFSDTPLRCKCTLRQTVFKWRWKIQQHQTAAQNLTWLYNQVIWIWFLCWINSLRMTFNYLHCYSKYKRMSGMAWVFVLIVSCFILIDLFSCVTFHFLSLSGR